MKRRAASVVCGLTRGVCGIASSERGATSAEYALILALVVVTLITTLSALGAALNEKLTDIINQISSA